MLVHVTLVPVCVTLHECPRAAATNGHERGFKQQNCICIVLEARVPSQGSAGPTPLSLESSKGRALLASSSFWGPRVFLGLWPHGLFSTSVLVLPRSLFCLL